MPREALALLPLLLLSCAATEGSEATPARRPNFVVLLADDLGWTDLGCYGSTFYETPNLDRLAASGVRFTQAYASAPVCSPTRASLLAGKYPARMDTTDFFGGRRKGALLPATYVDRLPLEETTIAEALAEAGYATFFAGKWHLGREGFHPEDQGFERNFGGFHRGSPPGGYFAPFDNPKMPAGVEGEHLTEVLTDACLGFLDDAGEAGERPFLLYLSYYAVHTPLQTKPAYEAKYAAKAKELRHDGPRFSPEGKRENRQVQDHAVYAGMIQSLDESVGRLLDALEERGLAEDTVILFTSDNGGLSTSEGHPTSNLPLRAGKGWLYEGGIREPMLVRWPGAARAGGTCDVPVCATDFYPTMLEMAGLPLRPEQHVDGLSLATLLRTGEAPARDTLFWHYPHYSNQGDHPRGAVRVGDWKLIESYETGDVELYDLAADLGEANDLAATHPERAAAMRARLAAWRGRSVRGCRARGPTRNSGLPAAGGRHAADVAPDLDRLPRGRVHVERDADLLFVLEEGGQEVRPLPRPDRARLDPRFAPPERAAELPGLVATHVGVIERMLGRVALVAPDLGGLVADLEEVRGAVAFVDDAEEGDRRKGGSGRLGGVERLLGRAAGAGPEGEEEGQEAVHRARNGAANPLLGVRQRGAQRNCNL